MDVITTRRPAALVSLYNAIASNSDATAASRDEHIKKLFIRLDRAGVTFKTQNEVIARATNKAGLNDLKIIYRQ